MRRSLACLVGVAFWAAAMGSAQAQESLEAKRDAKLASPWLKANGWLTDYTAAKDAAKKAGKPIFTYFTRSYSP